MDHFRKRSVVCMAFWEYTDIWCAAVSMFCYAHSIFAICQLFDGLILLERFAQINQDRRMKGKGLQSHSSTKKRKQRCTGYCGHSLNRVCMCIVFLSAITLFNFIWPFLAVS